MVRLRSRWQYTALITILLLAMALRLAPWGQNRFLEDEALYAYWGMQIASGANPMLNEEPVDKPPLHPYIVALSFLVNAPSLAAGVDANHETAARLPSLLASLAGILLVYALTRSLYPFPPAGRVAGGERTTWTKDGEATPTSGGEGIALLAALLLALSPFDILFASTAFTDPLMVALVLAALLTAARGNLGVAGILAGMAAATKQQALFFLPLLVAIGALYPPGPQNASRLPRFGARAPPDPCSKEGAGSPGRAGAERPKLSQMRWVLTGMEWGWRQRWLRFALGFALVVVATLWWDSARSQRPGFLEQSLISYGGLGPAQPLALRQRAVEWLQLAGMFWASPWFNGLLVLVLLGWMAGGRAGWWPGWSKVDLALALFVAGVLLLHWVIGFQVWDRYLLGLVPLIALLAARAFAALGAAIRSTRWRKTYAVGLVAVLAITLARPVRQAACSKLPVGGDHGAYDGIDQVAAYMRNEAPAGSVLYHYWLGYHYRFYLYGASLRLHWYPNLEDLVQDAAIYHREPRYIAFASWRDSSPAQAALAKAGISLVPVVETTRRDGSVSFRLYRLEGP